MPPSAITGMPCLAATSAQSRMAEICGTPTPETMRVVQIEPGPMPTLTRVGAGVDQVPGGLGRGDVAGDHIDLEALFDLPDGLDDVLRVAVGGVDDDDVDLRFDQGLDPLEVVHADGRSDPQPPAAVPGGERELLDAVDVPHRDQAGQFALVVHQEQFLDLVVPEDALGLFERGDRPGR